MKNSLGNMKLLNLKNILVNFQNNKISKINQKIRKKYYIMFVGRCYMYEKIEKCVLLNRMYETKLRGNGYNK